MANLKGYEIDAIADKVQRLQKKKVDDSRISREQATAEVMNIDFILELQAAIELEKGAKANLNTKFDVAKAYFEANHSLCYHSAEASIKNLIDNKIKLSSNLKEATRQRIREEIILSQGTDLSTIVADIMSCLD